MIDPNLAEVKGDCFIIDMMYARSQNMVGQPVYEQIGFGNRAYLHRDMWNILQKAEPWLKAHRLKLKICDAYRPPLAHMKLREIIPAPGFFALSPERSQHCRGTAVDVVLTQENGEELPYPTQVDAYRPDYAQEVQKGNMTAFFEYLKQARHDYENPDMATEIANRKELKALMENIGLLAIAHEWWHYNLPEGNTDKYPLIDFRP